MDIFADYLKGIDHPEQRERIEEVLTWVAETYPQLEAVVKWNEPMFTDHGTYIIGFSVSKKHMAVSPERAGMMHCAEEIKQSGYGQTELIIRIPWTSPVDYNLLKKMIEFNIEDKANYPKFWR